jgi:PAS domain S-box-containing protein
VTEETQKVLGRRRLQTLRELGLQVMPARTPEEACDLAAKALAKNAHDLPFTLIYLISPDGRRARLAGASGLSPNSHASPSEIDLEQASDATGQWPLAEMLAAGNSVKVCDVEARFGRLMVDPWPEPVGTAMLLPVTQPGHPQLTGFIIAGISPRRQFDDDYKGFLDLVTGQVAMTISDARAYESERKRAAALAEIDQAKTVFFNNISHEFRTPLTLMLGPVEDLLRSPRDLPAAAKSQLEMVNRNGLRLLRLVNTLLDFSRIEAKRVEGEFEPTDLAQTTLELAGVFRVATERAGLKLIVDCPPLPELVHVDREMWEKVVLNLVSNALKFTFEGEIEIRLRAEGPKAVMTVRDTGVGIPAAELPRLFERFHRVQNTRSRTQEGSGIGLAMVRELVKLHGGTISAESRLGAGTTFVVTLPLGSQHLPPDRVGRNRHPGSVASWGASYAEEALRWLPESSQSEMETAQTTAPAELHHPSVPIRGTNSGGRPRIVLADDNADMRQYLSRLLGKHYDIEALPDGQAAMEAARKQPPDLILGDVMMPHLDGLGLVREVRRDSVLKTVPIILLSARAGEQSQVEGLEEGADDYLVKPFSARELMARVAAHLQMARLRKEAGEKVKQSQERLRVTYEHAPVGICEVDLQGRFTNVNPRWCEITGYTRDELLERRIQDITHPDHVQADVHNFQRMQAADLPLQIREKCFVHKNGHSVWVELIPAVVRDAEGKACYGIAIIQDTTERKRAEAALRLSEERYRALFNTLIEGFCLIEVVFDAANKPLDYRFLETNPAFERQTGLREAQGKLMRDLTPFLDNHWFEIYGQIALTGVSAQFESEAKALGRWFKVSAFRMGGAESRKVAVLFDDITTRKSAEEALRESRMRDDFIKEAAQIGFWFCDLPFDVLNWDAVVKDHFWLPPEARVTIDTFYQRLHPDDRERTRQAIADSVANHSRYEIEYRSVSPDGREKWIRAIGRTFYDAAGHACRFDGLTLDVTDRKRAEDALYEAHRLLADKAKHLEALVQQRTATLRETVGDIEAFSYSISHDMRAPLRSMQSFAVILATDYADRLDAQGRDYLSRIASAAERMDRLIQDVLTYSRVARTELPLTPIDLKIFLEDILASYPMFQAPASQITLEGQFPAVLGVQGLLSQCVSNLLGNAVKFVTPGSIPRVRVFAESMGTDDTLRIFFQDNGIGIHPKDHARIFAMFERVSKDFDGTGIGLAIVKKGARQMGGDVGLKSELGQGSTFWQHILAGLEAGHLIHTICWRTN